MEPRKQRVSQRHAAAVRRKGIREDREAALAELSGDQSRRNAVYKTDPALFAVPERVRKTYTPEQRRELLARFDVLRAQGMRLLDIPAALGVSTPTIYAWRSQLKAADEAAARQRQRIRQATMNELLWGPEL